jgi:hypothetical protein
MRTSFGAFLAAVLVTLSGCNEGTPGGAGVTNPGRTPPTVGQAENTFKLNVPFLATTLKQGESKDLTIGIDRGKNFEGDVSLVFDDPPKGVTINSAKPVIQHGDTEAKVTLKASSDAALGDFSVKVKGHPSKGPDATSELRISVVKS